ncbi:hypothetical protein EDD85DRAFT_128482 [Armillaria nabsnona]|nr:hypothetical protein EDD85DRAFT_128482 [Armillaria nabsnona]
MMSPGSPVSVIRFVPRRQQNWLLTLSEEYSALTICDITHAHMCSEWSSKGATLTEIAINADPESEASIAVLLFSIGIVLLNLDDNGTLHEIRTIDMNLRPVALTSDIMALTDDLLKTVIYNWKTNERAYLDEGGGSHHNQLRSRLYPFDHPCRPCLVNQSLHRPPLLDGQTHIPLASHSFN